MAETAHPSPHKWSDLKVGIFVMAALSAASVLIFAIGSKSHLFASKTTYHSAFRNVGGLAAGSPVRIAGVTVGSVDEVKIGNDGHILVTFHIVASSKNLIRKTSKTSLGNKGLLGDKLLEVSPGQGELVPQGGWIPSENTVELSDYMSKAGTVLAHVEATAKNLHLATEPFADQQFSKNLTSATKNISDMVALANRGDGIVHRLLTDKALADDIAKSMHHVQLASQELSQTLGSVRQLTHSIEKGPGMAHDLLFGPEGRTFLKKLTDVSSEVSTAMAQIRTQKSLAHEVLYGSNSDELLVNLNAMAADLKSISHDIRTGRGSLGAIIQDPSLYEDLKRLVGNLERNDVLKALVRYSIKHDQKK